MATIYKANNGKSVSGGKGFKNYAKDYGLLLADSALGTFGASDVINEKDYNTKLGDVYGNDIADTLGGINNQIAATGLNTIMPGSGQLFSMGTGAINNATTKDIGTEQFNKGQNVAQGAMGIMGNFMPKMNMGGDPTLMALMGNPQYEAEGQEVVQGQPIAFNGQVQQNASDMATLKGPSHSNGGMKMSGGDRVFSDSIKMPNMKHTFANHADKLGKMKGKYEKQLDKSKNDKLSVKTAMMNIANIDKQIDDLFNTQEQLKQEMFAKDINKVIMKYGGKLPKMNDGGNLNGYKFNPVTRTYTDVMGNTITEPQFEALNMISNNNAPVAQNTASKTVQPATVAINNTNNDTSNTVVSNNTTPGFFKRNQELIRKGLYQGQKNAPSYYNLGKGLFDKAEQLNYEDYVNPYEQDVMSRLEGLNFNIDPQLASNQRAFNTMNTQIKDASGGNAATYLSNVGASQLRKMQGDAELYAAKNNADNQYKSQAALTKAGFGDKRAAIKLNAADFNFKSKAAKDKLVADGLTGFSNIAQMDELMQNQKDMNYLNFLAETAKTPNFKIGSKFNRLAKGTSYEGLNPEDMFVINNNEVTNTTNTANNTSPNNNVSNQTVKLPTIDFNNIPEPQYNLNNYFTGMQENSNAIVPTLKVKYGGKLPSYKYGGKRKMC